MSTPQERLALKKERTKLKRKQAKAKKKEMLEKKAEKPATPPKYKLNQKYQKRAKNTLQQVAVEANLTKREQAIAYEYVNNFLYPTKPMKLARPISSFSASIFKSGELVWESDSEFVEVRFRPDPWFFVEIQTQAGGGVVNLQESYEEDLGALLAGSDTEQIPAGGTDRICFQMPLSLTNGTQVLPVFRFNSVPLSSVRYGYVQGETACGYYSIEVGGTVTFAVKNLNPWACTAAVDFYIVNADETVASTTLGTPVAVATQTTVHVASANLTGMQPSGDQIGCFVIRINNTSANSIFYKNFTFTLVQSSAPIQVSTAPTSTYYTLGEALYGSAENAQAVELMNMFNTCQVWSPVACAALLNVSQVLADAGGRFLSSFLPPFISDTIPSDPAKEWTTLASYKNSYPFYEGKFDKGTHGTWVGTRIQDYEYRKPFTASAYQSYQRESLPMNILMSNPAKREQSFKYFFTFSVCFEVQSVNPLLTMTKGPVSTQLLPMMLAIIVLHSLLVGENPSHFTRLAKLAKTAVNDPKVRKAFKELAGAGMAALML